MHLTVMSKVKGKPQKNDYIIKYFSENVVYVQIFTNFIKMDGEIGNLQAKSLSAIKNILFYVFDKK